MDKAIRLAIEKGGYVADELLAEKLKVGGNIFKVEIYPVILDPLFWIALGRALGWRVIDENETTIGQDQWKREWHNYISYLIAGGDTEKFWKELLTQNNYDQT